MQFIYLETVLQAHLTVSAKATLATLREQLKKKVIETMREFELHSKRSTRGTVDEGGPEERKNLPISPEELNVSVFLHVFYLFHERKKERKKY